jgi:5-keto 4-deoxyuronate isomerase
MHISNSKYRLTQLTRELVEPCAKLLGETFLAENEVWATMNLGL